MENSYAVIMAGGIGSRFWPKSRQDKPKQYLSLIDDGTLIQNTAARLKGLFNDEQIIIVSTEPQKQLIHEQLPWLTDAQLYFEPLGRNTAPAVGLAAVNLLHRDKKAVMVVLPADHRITKTNIFLENLRTALQVVNTNKDALVTIGIVPSYAATGYGYIEATSEYTIDNVLQVNRFREKPDKETAASFVKSGKFFWNSGMYIWRADRILEQFKKFMPDWYDGLMEIKDAIGHKEYWNIVSKVYQELEGQSIDYGIMEHATEVYMVKAGFEWNDLGSWEEVYNISPKDENNNVISGKPLLKNVKNSYIQAGDRVMAVIGMENVIIIDEPDALLVCRKDQSQDVRWTASKLGQK